MLKKYLPYRVVSPLQHPGKERNLPLLCICTFWFRWVCSEARPRSARTLLAARVIAVRICRFPGVLPADVTTASLFVLFNHAPTLKLPSNYCSQLLGAQEPTLITEFPAHEGCPCCRLRCTDLEALLQTHWHPGPASPLEQETEIPGLAGGLTALSKKNRFGETADEQKVIVASTPRSQQRLPAPRSPRAATR